MENITCWSKAVAETIMRRHPDVNSYPFKPWCYPQGFVLWGFEKLWETTGGRKYYDYIMNYADGHVDDEGNISCFKGNSMDDIMTGSILVWAYKQTGLQKYKLACDKIREVFNTYPRTSHGGFWHAIPKVRWNQMWVDGVFMGQMFLTKYGKYIGDSEYCFNEAAKQLELIEYYCKKGDTGLLYHAWCEDRSVAWADEATGCSPEVWSEGLGWYALILVEVLEIFPQEHPKREQIANQLKRLLEGLKKTQDAKTGLWYQVVDKGDLPDNWHETSGSSMFVYAIKKAMELGFADAKAYGPVAEKGYQGITGKAKVDESGLIDIFDACDGLCVKKSYDEYIHHPQKVNAQEVVAAFLWATWIMEKPKE